jgi:amino acid adenylation domain-containing protein
MDALERTRLAPAREDAVFCASGRSLPLRLLSTAESTTLVGTGERPPLSFAQQRLWFLAQMKGASEAYHIPFGVRLHGRLDGPALRRALDRIVARHEALRTSFPSIDGEPVQWIIPVEASSFHLVEHDLRRHIDTQGELDRLIAEEARTSFDLEAGPLIRGRLIRRAEDEHILLITMHHIVSDGWSKGVLINELSALYGAFLRDEADPLPELSLQYADYAVWQRQWIEGEGGIPRQQADYWKTTLAGAPQLLELPTDRARPAQQDYAGDFLEVELDKDLTAGLKGLSRRHGTTLYMTLLAGWAALLARLSGQQDVVIGTPVANRGRVEIEGLIGFFVNTLALRLDGSGSPTVGELLERVKVQVIAALQHQDIPFERVVEIARPMRSLAHSPLFQVMFTWQNAAKGRFELPGLEVQPLHSAPHVVAKFDLTLSLREAGGRIVGGLKYATALFERSTVERYLRYFRRLLEGMVAGDTQVVDRLLMLTGEERQKVLYEWNATEVEYPGNKCVHELFEEQVRKTPDAVAVVFQDMSLSYAELNRRANQLAHYLRGLGVKPDARLAICVERGFEMIVGLLAVLKAGGAYVPLDPAYPRERLRYMLADSAPVALLTQGHLKGLFPEASDALPVINLADEAPPWKEQPETDPDRAGAGLSAGHLAYVIYTSGSTGSPKGVMVEHGSLSNYLLWAKDAYYRQDGSGSPAVHSIGFDGLITTLFGPIICGQTLTLLPRGTEIESLAKPGSSRTVPYSLLKLTPSHLKLLNRAISLEETQAPARTLMIGGETLIPSDVLFWQRRFPGVRLVNHFGPTETTVGCCTFEIAELATETNSIPIGRPIANTRIYILDSQGEPVPVGVTGELYIGGAGVARGYLNRPELTAERFLADPFVADGQARMYKTGDLGRWLPEGTIEFVGRNDFQVKMRGFRIELGEIEASLREHGGIREAVVLAREDRAGEKRLVAYYACRESGGPGAGELRAHLAERLPDYMVPAAYVRLEWLPLTPNGKLDRQALPGPEAEAYAGRGYEAPQGEMEGELARIWAEVLKVERVGRHDNFFELGGHSLLAVRVITQLQRALSVEVTISDLFARPVLAHLAHGLEIAARAEVPSITVAERGESLPLSFAQQRMWFLAQMEGVSEVYHIPRGLGLRGSLDGKALRRALDWIVRRHEALRTTFVLIEANPVQRIAPARDSHFQLVEHDLRQNIDAQGELERLITEEARNEFDLQAGPLIRGRLIRQAENEHTLLITMHHIVSDGWSMRVLINELSVLYSAFARGEADPLPELSVQYADYAVWQRKWMEGDIPGKQAEYWKKTLAGAPALLELPADHARPAQQDHTGASAKLVLDENLTSGLRALGKRHGATLYMTLLAGWAALLGRLSGQRDVMVGTPMANRGRVEIEGLIGFFVNTLVLRLDVSGSPTVGELLDRVKAQAVAAQQHQDIPFEQVVEITRPVRSLSHSPLFQVMFAWQNANEGALELPGLDVRAVRAAPHVVAKFDLTLTLREVKGRIAGGIEYATSLFERPTVERYLGYFRRLLEAMVAGDTRTVDRLPILTDVERHRVLVEWNGTEVEFPSQVCIHELFEAQVRKAPEAVAVVFEDATLSYGELNRRANRLAHYLRGLRVKPDARVAICLERGFEMIVALLAVLKAGGAYVPLDPAYPVERLRYMLADSGPVALLTQGHPRGLFSGIGEALPVIDLTAPDPPWQDRPQTNPDRAGVGLTSRHLAYVIYTSGSTGQPKGVMVEHRGVCNLASAQVRGFAVDSESRVLQFASFSFDASIFEVVMALCQGASLHLVAQAEIMAGGTPIQTIKRTGITHATLPPAVLASLPDEAGLDSVRTLIVAGDALTGELAKRWGQGRRLINAYGPTEATVCATLHDCQPHESGNPPIGRPIANTRIYILDSQGEPVPVGVAGELYIGGAGVARGYLNRPDLTAERFLADPFVADGQARMYKTGDLGRWLPEGTIEFVGRNDFQVKMRGFRIELGEIEARLREHGGIREAVVLAREDAVGEKRLVAYYACRESGGPGAGELRAHLAERLPDYMVPAAYVRLEWLPLTPNGKLDRQALPGPEAEAYAGRGYEAPRGEMEEELARIWGEVLKVRVGRHDNFFELGGHSLLALTLMEHMRRSGLHLDVRALFVTRTLAELAVTVGGQAHVVEVPPNRIPERCDAIVPEMLPLVELTQKEIERIVESVPGGAANVQDIYPLAPLQKGILFHHLMGGRGDPYLLASQFSFDSRARMEAYLKALQGVIDRHDILRTSVMREGLSEPVQVVWRKVVLPVEEIELDPAAGDVAGQLHARCDPRQYRIDVGRAPLLRVYVAYDRAQERWLMVQLLHHLAGDHSALEVMREEIEAHLLGRADRLPAPLPFRNLVAQARLGVSGEEHEEFFRRLLGDVDEPTVAFGLLDVQGDGTGVNDGRIILDADLARRIRERARKLGVSAASLCHLAWAQVLARVSGREDVVFGTVVFGRMQGGEGGDRVMGMFINTLPVRIRTGEEGVEASVRRTHAQLAGLMRHEHASLALAQRCSAVAAPMPLFSALLNYRHSVRAAHTRSAEGLRAWEGIGRLRGGRERTNYPLMLSVDDLGDSFMLTAQVQSPIEPLRLCHYMRRALQSMVEALERSPARAVRTLDVLPEEERRKVLYEWNGTEAEFPSQECIHELFEEQVRKAPDAVAVIFEDATLSYAELNRRANRLAHYLRGLGVKPDARVAICLERGLEMIVALLAVLKAGGAYVPLDPAYPVERLRYMLADSGPLALLTQGHLRGLFSGIGEALPVIDLGGEDRQWQDRPETNPEAAGVGLTSRHPAYVIYTSGSTGQPKGVMGLHRATVNRFTWMYNKYPFVPGEVCCAKSTITFVDSVWELFGPLLKGVPTVLLPAASSYDLAEFVRILAKHRVTRLVLVPSLLRALIDSHSSGDLSLPELKYWIASGEPLPRALARELLKQIGKGTLLNLYGSSEDGADVTCHEVESADGASPLPIGRPIANTRIYILDSQGEPVPVGVAGELYIGGAGVARGYLNRPELTAERFLADPFVADGQARMYKTGDLGRWLPEGTIEFVGRNDFQVKMRGFRIELGEIEARLREHGGIREAVVLAREDGAGEKRLVAYYACRESGGPGAGELRAHLAEKLPDYMVPAAYVRLEWLPLTPNGKLDRQALPGPEAEAYAGRGYEAPRGEMEGELARIWGEVLKVERVGRHDNFFELGGHSLLALTLMEHMRWSGLQMDIRTLFAAPRLAELAAAVSSQSNVIEVFI